MARADEAAWCDLQVIAKAYDNPIPGYGTATVGNLRLWEALPTTELDLDKFNEGKFAEVRLSQLPVPWRLQQLTIHAGPSSACSHCGLSRLCGCMLQAVEGKRKAEDISAVLYPNDATDYGKELRLKQQVFFVSASIQVRCCCARLLPSACARSSKACAAGQLV